MALKGSQLGAASSISACFSAHFCSAACIRFVVCVCTCAGELFILIEHLPVKSLRFAVTWSQTAFLIPSGSVLQERSVDEAV